MSDDDTPFDEGLWERIGKLTPQAPEPSRDTVTIKGRFVATPHGAALTISVQEDRSGRRRIYPRFSLIGQTVGYVHDDFPGLRLSRQQLEVIDALCESFRKLEPETKVETELFYRFTCKLLPFSSERTSRPFA